MSLAQNRDVCSGWRSQTRRLCVGFYSPEGAACFDRYSWGSGFKSQWENPVPKIQDWEWMGDPRLGMDGGSKTGNGWEIQDYTTAVKQY